MLVNNSYRVLSIQDSYSTHENFNSTETVIIESRDSEPVPSTPNPYILSLS